MLHNTPKKNSVYVFCLTQKEIIGCVLLKNKNK